MTEVVNVADQHLMRGDDVAANPSLSDQDLELLRPHGHERVLVDGEILYRPGDPLDTFYVVLSGEIWIEDGAGEQRRVISEQRRGNFLGEYGLLTGGLAYMTNAAHGKTALLCVPVSSLLEIVASQTALGETILRAVLLRRATLVGTGLGVRVLGSPIARETRRLVEFLARNRIPHAVAEPESPHAHANPPGGLAIEPGDLPLVVLGDRALPNPSLSELATGLGITASQTPTCVIDLAVVGAGPAGLAASVYAASEGLNTVLLDAISVGGQAGTSSRIENYLGFPAGVSGAELAARASVQASKFGTYIVTPKEAVGLAQDGDEWLLRLGEGEELAARSVVVATGAQYRGLDLPRVDELAGAGVYYAATQFEAEACRGQRVAIVGGGNSAGQAALFLADHAETILLIVRRPGLEETMSHYLVTRVLAHDRITVCAQSEVTNLLGETRLEAATVRSSADGASAAHEVSALFVFTGARPHTEWLASVVELDEAGFVVTGPSLETSRPGVFAVGDVRSGSTKRVAAAVGEGSMAIRFVHAYLQATSE